MGIKLFMKYILLKIIRKDSVNDILAIPKVADNIIIKNNKIKPI